MKIRYVVISAYSWLWAKLSRIVEESELSLCKVEVLFIRFGFRKFPSLLSIMFNSHLCQGTID